LNAPRERALWAPLARFFVPFCGAQARRKTTSRATFPSGVT